MGFYSSATLIKDGQRHGVKFLPVDVMKSDWDCTVAPDYSIRLGLRVVKILSSTGAKKILAQREKAPFVSLDDFKRRVRLNKDELRTLAEIGALNCFASHRRDALWKVEKEMHEDDLFERWGETPSSPNCFNRIDQGSTESRPTKSISPLMPMNYSEPIQDDFAGLHLTTGKHPMALLRSRLPGVWRAVDLPKAQHGSVIRIAGNVICRQRPGTAKGFVFISLEDETGISNAVVTPPMFEANRLLITEESFLLIEGRLQHIENVIHVKAEKIERLDHGLFVGATSYDFH